MVQNPYGIFHNNSFVLSHNNFSHNCQFNCVHTQLLQVRKFLPINKKKTASLESIRNKPKMRQSTPVLYNVYWFYYKWSILSHKRYVWTVSVLIVCGNTYFQ